MKPASLQDVARELLERSEAADPHDLVPKFIGVLTNDQADELVRKGALVVLQEVLRHVRATQMAVGPSKWSIAHHRVVAPGGWQMLADCTADDLLAIAERLRSEGAALIASAGWHAELAGRLRSAGVATVRDLVDAGLASDLQVAA